MNTDTSNINWQIAKCHNISAYYHFWNVDDYIAEDITKIIFNCSIHYPRDIFYNMSYPDLDFELTKLNNEQIYQITFVGYGWVSDTYLQFTKDIYNALQQKYSISIVFLDEKRNLTLKYSNKNYWKALLINNFIIYLLLPPVIILMFSLGNYLVSLLSTVINSKIILEPILENAIYPLICLLYTSLSGQMKQKGKPLSMLL